MAAVALAHGLNATMLRKWVVDAEGRGRALEMSQPSPSSTQTVPMPAASFVALQLPPAAPAAAIRIELQRAGLTVNVSWPASEAAACAVWLRELLR